MASGGLRTAVMGAASAVLPQDLVALAPLQLLLSSQRSLPFPARSRFLAFTFMALMNSSVGGSSQPRMSSTKPRRLGFLLASSPSSTLWPLSIPAAAASRSTVFENHAGQRNRPSRHFRPRQGNHFILVSTGSDLRCGSDRPMHATFQTECTDFFFKLVGIPDESVYGNTENPQ